MEYVGFVVGLSNEGKFFSECEIIEDDFALDIAIELFLRDKAEQYRIVENIPVLISLKKPIQSSSVVAKEIKLNPDLPIVFGGESFVAGYGLDKLSDKVYICLFVVDKWHFIAQLLVRFCSAEDLPNLLNIMYDSSDNGVESCQEICDRIIEIETPRCGFCSVLIYHNSKIYRGEKNEKGLH